MLTHFRRRANSKKFETRIARQVSTLGKVVRRAHSDPAIAILNSLRSSYDYEGLTTSDKHILPDVAAQFHVGAAAAAPRASRAGLPLCGSGPDNVWQNISGAN